MSVGENEEMLRGMFPQFDLTQFFLEYRDQEVDWACDYILNNPHVFKAIVMQPSGSGVSVQANNNNLNKTIDPAVPAPKEKLNFSDAIFLSRLEKLADYFFEQKDNIQDRETPIDLSWTLCYMFPSVKKVLTDALIGNKCKYSTQSIFALLFFVNNNLTHLNAFKRITNQFLKNCCTKNVDYYMSLLFRRRTQKRDFREVFPRNLPRFEAKLIELAIDSYDNFALLSWKDGLVRDIIPPEKLRMFKFECEVCCEEYFMTDGFSCDNTVSAPPPNGDEPSSSKRINLGSRVADGDVHTFCTGCIRGQVEATLSGAMLDQTGLGIQCLASDCKNPILFRHIENHIPRQIRAAFEKKLVEKNLYEAALEGLEYCLKCDFAMMMEVPKEENKVFRCENCRYEYCRFCKVNWSVHFGKSCAEVKTDMSRHELENKLSEAIIRYCPKCNLQFVKLEACNKMVCCNCKTTMCYICRTANINYEHFCNHVRDPAHPNAMCIHCKVKKCLLWEDYKKHDEAKIADIMNANKSSEISQSIAPNQSMNKKEERSLWQRIQLFVSETLERLFMLLDLYIVIPLMNQANDAYLP